MSEILLLLSLMGFFLFLKWLRKGLHPSFYPAVTVSAVSVLTCLGGIAGILRETAHALLLFGLLSLIVFGTVHFRKMAREKRREEDRPFLWMLGSFLFFCACLTFLMRNRFIYHYDDFSHWALVARIMLKENRLPVSADGLMFPSYPLGAASFIYFCGSALGSGAKACLLGQNIMLVSFLLSLQSAAGGKRTGYMLTTAAIPLFLCYNTPPDSLSVDNLLGAALLAALLMLFRPERALRQSLPELAAVLACCVLIKNSGVFLASGLIALVLIRTGIKKDSVSAWTLCLAFPLLIYLAWRLHLKAGFSTFGKHYMSLYTYYGTLRGRLGEIGMILGVILPVMMSPLRNHAWLLIPAFALVFLGSAPEKRKAQREKLLICAVLFVFYEAGILVMYICSMGTGELLAQNGADFPRYNGTIIVALAGALAEMAGDSFFSSSPPGSRKKKLFFLVSLALTAGCIGLNMKPLQSLEKIRAECPEAYAFSERTEEQTISEAQPFEVYCRQPDVTEYEMYMANYYLFPSKHIRLYGSGENPRGLEEGSAVIDLR